MKKTFLILVATFSLSFASVSKAQKIAYINTSELIQLMPESAAANKTLETLGAELQAQLKTMTTELQTKYADYLAKEAKMDPSVKALQQEELTKLQARIEEFKTKAEEAVKAREEELLEPILEKAKKAIQEVGKEKGYEYVLDSSLGNIILSPESANLLEAVKAKLKITTPAKK